jgi:release factor glutamine methyltransferase
MRTFAKIGKTMNSRKLLAELMGRIHIPEPESEIREMVLMLLEYRLNMTRTEILTGRNLEQSERMLEQLYRDIERINRHEPVQYITGKAWFYGYSFRVTPDVLIPRPETEELVDVVRRILSPTAALRIVDVGTGSGCIAITLRKLFPRSEVWGIDISAEALEVARRNADEKNAAVHFLRLDFLRDALPLKGLDLLVSNPPYVTAGERQRLGQRVAGHEPHVALFVPDDDPLIFYRALAEKGRKALKRGGMILAEINERLGQETANVFSGRYYRDVHILRDLSGKDRFVQAALS